MSFAIIIPTQERNIYHKLGDVAPFGDTTLLEWKISQCKEFAESSQIYISSESEIIKEIAENEEVNFIKRESNQSYIDIVINSISQVKEENIVLVNCTAPFLNSKSYKYMVDRFLNEKLDSLITVEKRNQYVFYKNEKLNFSDNFISRRDIEPIYIMTNGCYIIKKEIALKLRSLLTKNPVFFELDSFEAIEISDIKDYVFAKELINMYFKKEFNV